MERIQYSSYSYRRAGNQSVATQPANPTHERKRPGYTREAVVRLEDRKIEEPFFVRTNRPAIMRKGQDEPVLLLSQKLKITGSYFTDDHAELLVVAENKVLLLRNISSHWRIINQFTSIDEREKHTGNTVLMAAITENNRTLVDLLIRAGSSINAYNQKGWFPLYLAVAKERVESVTRLIRGRADMRQVTNDNERSLPLHCVAMTNRVDIARLLLNAMVPGDVNRRCRESGCTPLHLAAYCGCTDMCELLWQYQGKIDQQIIRTENQLDEEEAFQKGYTPLHLAVASKQVPTTFWLIAKGAEVNAVSDRGETPLHIAAVYGLLEQARLLLDHGANIDAECNDDNARTPLFKAVRNKQQAMVEYLIKKRASLNLRSWGFSITPLHYAVLIEHIPIVNSLVNAGCDLNTHAHNYEAFFDTTPLRLAIKQNCFTLCVILLRAKVRLSREDIAYAIRKNHIQLGGLLCKMYALSAHSGIAPIVSSSWVSQHLMHTAILSNDIHQLISLLRTRTVTANTPRNSDGCRPLHLALLTGKPETVSLLLHLGANYQKRNKDGYVALFMAKNEEVADLVRNWSGEQQLQSLKAMARKVLWQYLGCEALNLYLPEFSSEAFHLSFFYQNNRINPLRLRSTSKEIIYGRLKDSASFNTIRLDAVAKETSPNLIKYGLSIFSTNSLLMDYLRLSIPPMIYRELQAA